MNRIWILVAFLTVILLLVACTEPAVEPTPPAEPAQALPTNTPLPTSTPEPTPVPPTDTPLPTSTPEPTLAPPTDTPSPTTTPMATSAAEEITPVTYPGLPLPKAKGVLFSASGVCAVCHTGLVDESGTDVSIDSFWRSTMMANAARDPYWQASVQEEVLSHPDYQEIIEDTCATCHMPMARFTASANDEKGQAFGDGFINPENKLHTLAMDGVSCTLCHQIEKTGLGETSSFNGGFIIDTELSVGERLNFGPYSVDEKLGQMMQKVSGFLPVESRHIGQSEICATCHTLSTPTIDATGQVVGEFPEQMPYFEWLHSDYQDAFACQECHMPEAQGAVVISNIGGNPHSPFSKHTFVGGNVYLLNILQTFGNELEVTASSEQFQATIERTQEQLQHRTATIAFEDMSLSGSQLTASVVIKSQVGHKFPTGFPARRVWLRFVVHDAAGQTVFESGGFNLDGSINGNDNDADPTAYEPHYSTIVVPDQVQIYEAIIRDAEGKVTTTLLKGAGYLKDNRLLPSGFEKSTAEDNIAVYGQATDDPDMIGGEDKVQYDLDLGDAEGPFTVTVELLYQSIGYRWVQNLGQYEGAEIDRFLDYSEAVPNLPLVVASETIEVE